MPLCIAETNRLEPVTLIWTEVMLLVSSATFTACEEEDATEDEDLIDEEEDAMEEEDLTEDEDKTVDEELSVTDEELTALEEETALLLREHPLTVMPFVVAKQTLPDDSMIL